MKVVGLEEPVCAVMPAMKIDPLHGTFGQRDFMSDEAHQGDTRNHGMLKAVTKRGFAAMKIASGKVPLERSCACGNAVEFDSGTRRITGDLQGLCGRETREGKREGE